MQLYSKLGHGDGCSARAAEAATGGSHLWQVLLQPLQSGCVMTPQGAHHDVWRKDILSKPYR